jgi:hypothetical protein
MSSPARSSWRFWGARLAGFALTVLGLCALGALLGALIFPLAGRLGGSHLSRDEMVVAGVKSGAFIFMVWAPGAALVREFIRGSRSRRASRSSIASSDTGDSSAEKHDHASRHHEDQHREPKQK